MGLFNTLRARIECPACGEVGLFEIQFKYGGARLNEYVLGDKLKWDYNCEGEPNCKKVLVESISPKCPSCAIEHVEFNVIIENDVLSSVVPVGTERLNPTDNPDGYYVVLER
jgi:hypothetical protein